MSSTRDRPRNPYLLGNQRPVFDELDVLDLAIEGAWPAALQGTLVQNGPNPAFPPEGTYHPFEGSGMLHALRIDGTQASYRNRFVATPDYLRERAAGRALAVPLGAAATDELLVSGRYPYRDAANTLLLSHAGTGWALNDFHPPIRVDPRTLETLGREQVLGDALEPFTAHPKRDPHTGELFYFRTRVGPEPVLTLGAVDMQGRQTFEAGVELLRPRLMHDFAVSQHWAVFFDTGVAFDREQARAGRSGWAFDPAGPSQLLLVPREGGQPLRFALEPCVIVHALNAWESSDGRWLHVFAVRYPCLPDALLIDPTESAADARPPDANHGRLWRWTLDLRTGDVVAGVLSQTAADFPRQDEALLMRPTRRAWLNAHLPLGALVEVDLELGRERVLRHGRGRYGGEFVFVAQPEAAPECGWLLGYVWDATCGTSEVVALDSEHPESGPVARVRLPRRVPFGFHVSWFPGV